MRTLLISVAGRTGRSISVMLPIGARDRTIISVEGVLAPPLVRTMIGKSDHAGWAATLLPSNSIVSSLSASSATTAPPAPLLMQRAMSAAVSTTSTGIRECSRTSDIRIASLPKGARTWTRQSVLGKRGIGVQFSFAPPRKLGVPVSTP